MIEELFSTRPENTTRFIIENEARKYANIFQYLPKYSFAEYLSKDFDRTLVLRTLRFLEEKRVLKKIKNPYWSRRSDFYLDYSRDPKELKDAVQLRHDLICNSLVFKIYNTIENANCYFPPTMDLLTTDLAELDNFAHPLDYYDVDYLIPDAAILNKDTRSVSFYEVELTRKSYKRFSRKVMDYVDICNINFTVHFIFLDRKVQNSYSKYLKRILQDHNLENGLYNRFKLVTVEEANIYHS